MIRWRPNTGLTKADAIRQYLEAWPGQSTATQIAKALALDAAYVSSFLNKEFKAGRVRKSPGKGPRGGNVWG